MHLNVRESYSGSIFKQCDKAEVSSSICVCVCVSYEPVVKRLLWHQRGCFTAAVTTGHPVTSCGLL